MKTIVLLSGGIDSALVLAAAVDAGDKCLALGFDYGQKHRIELDRAAEIARLASVSFEIVVLPAMPKVDDVVFAGRNLVFAANAVAIAQARGFDRIAVGCNANDWLRFPDCRPPFWRNLEICAEAYGIGVVTPLIYLSKRDIIERARHMGVPLDLTWSCYSPQSSPDPFGEAIPCGECLACETRKEALR